MRLPLALAVLAAAAGPAYASPVIEVREDGTTVTRNDPFLPAADLQEPRVTEGTVPPVTGVSLRGRTSGSGPTVKEALAAALEAGEITQEQHDVWRQVLRNAQRTRAQLTDARRAQMQAQLSTLYGITRARQLTASRMPALFLQLQRNTEYWPISPYPASGARVVFEGSELVFQYYAGYGLQIQPLANFGKANALWRNQRVNRLRLLLDELVAIASRRGRFTAWEYWFRFGGGTPPWMSAMAQGTAIQAFARGSQLLAEPVYLAVARGAIRAFSTRAPTGVRAAGRAGGNHYLIYSFSRGLRVLNAFAQTLNGLYDYAQIAGHARALALFQKGDVSLRAELPDYDTGAWTLYSLGGAEATSEYHGLATDFVGNLCERTADATYCDAAARFQAYETESPRMELLTTSLKAGAGQLIRFNLSKRSTVQMTISHEGSVVYTATLDMAYGQRSFAWTPPKPGDYVVTLAATSFNGTQGSASGNITVR